MHDRSVSLSRIATASCWVMMVLTFGVGAWLFAAGQHDLAIMLGIKAVLWAAVAGVLTVRCMAIRVCNLIRVTGRMDLERVPDLHSLR